MTTATRIWPLLTGLHRYEKIVSTRNRGKGVFIEAPILAYLIETPNGRILYDAGCDYSKINTPGLCEVHYGFMAPMFDVPQMTEEQRIPNYLKRLGLSPADIDLIFIGHLHFDHAGGLCDFPHCDIHVHKDEMEHAGGDAGVFAGEVDPSFQWKLQSAEYDVAPGIRAVASPGHTAGHMSLFIELPKGPPVILCGDAADLEENLREEVAPGFCWKDDEAMALDSIRKLKRLGVETGGRLWPSHDLNFFNSLAPFPAYVD